MFIEHYVESVQQKIVPDLYLILVNNPKYSQCVQETLL